MHVSAQGENHVSVALALMTDTQVDLKLQGAANG